MSRNRDPVLCAPLLPTARRGAGRRQQERWAVTKELRERANIGIKILKALAEDSSSISDLAGEPGCWKSWEQAGTAAQSIANTVSAAEGRFPFPQRADIDAANSRLALRRSGRER